MDRRNKPSALVTTPALPPQPRVDFVGDRVTAVLPSTGEAIAILLTGATVISWTGSDGEERLWLSNEAVLDGSKAVRGGVPIVFPIFGKAAADDDHAGAVAAAKLPQHGLARTSRWEFLGKTSSEGTSEGAGPSSSGGDAADAAASVQLDFGLSAASADPALQALWPHDFALLYRVTLAPGRLTTNIVVTNEGRQPFSFQVLLHTYLHVKDIAAVHVSGLDGSDYADKVSKTAATQSGPVTIAGETDRVYRPSNGTAAALTVAEAGKPRFIIERDNLTDVVVWNPWSAKAQAMADFAPKDGFRQMLCVEPGAVAGWTTLEPGEAFEGAQSIQAV